MLKKHEVGERASGAQINETEKACNMARSGIEIHSKRLNYSIIGLKTVTINVGKMKVNPHLTT